MNTEIERIQTLLSSVWPEWRITKRIGKGSYGAVYEIIRDDLGNGSGFKCALKVLEMEADDMTLTQDATVHVLDSSAGLQGISGESQTELLEEFVRGVSNEINLMLELKGTPNIVSIEDYIVLRDRNIRTILIRTELLQGIDQISELQHGMDRDEVVRLGIDICSALVRCEEKNIIHRDIKPGNLFYSENAGYKLGDFGISRTMESIHERMSMSGVGTIQYMAPEVYFGGRYDHTVDIYSLGLTLYTLLNENLPPLYESTSPQADTGSTDARRRREANMRRLRGEVLPAPTFADDQLASVILTACDPDPARRFQSAAAFRSALTGCLMAVKPGPGNGTEPPKPNPPVSPTFLIWAAALVVLAIALFILFRPSGKKEAKEVAYSIICKDTDGNILNQQDLTGTVGQTVVYTAQNLEGYTVEDRSQKILLSENANENRLVFVYEKEADAADSGAGGDSGEDTPPKPAETPETPATIQWTDSNLGKAVKKYLGTDDEITPEYASGVSELVLDSSDISDISDLQYFTGLEKLSLADNFVSDISPLTALTGLHELNLEKNLVQNVKPLRNMTSLRRLDLYQNSVSDISALSGLTKLNMLDLRENNVTDLSACSDMISMEELYLTSNPDLSDISSLAGMSSLWYLGLKNTKVQDISVLSRADNLSTLILANTRVTNLEPIRSLPVLSYLDIRGCSLDNSSVVDQLKKRDGFQLKQ